MNPSNSNDRPTSFSWYSHPLTSLIVVSALAALLAIPFGVATAAVSLAAMLTFLTSCTGFYNRQEPRPNEDDEQ
ncbi:lipase maturation factor family protein [Rhodococcus erythropolis]|uniref:hypothetical protein n=1 Tax=Rhodococcus erythropolis TaxID=1833 RepID=UPI001C9A86C1|nr:hypothetical protein [Rhodococcus erythropolis]MBY6388582.1 lipase maturation factor family protein [Rhodococcus erythropolis]